MPCSKDPSKYSEEFWALVNEPERFTFPLLLGPMPARAAQRWRFTYYGFLNALRAADERARRKAQAEHAAAVRHWQGQGARAGAKPELSLPYVCETAQRADFFDKRYILRLVGGGRRRAPAGDEPTYLQFELRSISDVGRTLLAQAAPVALQPLLPPAQAPQATQATIDPYEAFMQMGRAPAPAQAPPEAAPEHPGANVGAADKGDSK